MVEKYIFVLPVLWLDVLLSELSHSRQTANLIIYDDT